MGWDFCEGWRTKKDVLAELLRPGRYGEGSVVLASKSVPGGCFAVWNLASGERFIEVALIEKDRGCYGYKSMDEGMGPYFAEGCPLEFLELAPERSPAWRARVRGTA